jgi:hypothetical protein
VEQLSWVFAPMVVMPAWVSTEYAEVHHAVLAHDAAHISARDPQFLTCALVLLAVMLGICHFVAISRLRRAMDLSTSGEPSDNQDNVLGDISGQSFAERCRRRQRQNSELPDFRR